MNPTLFIVTVRRGAYIEGKGSIARVSPGARRPYARCRVVFVRRPHCWCLGGRRKGFAGGRQLERVGTAGRRQLVEANIEVFLAGERQLAGELFVEEVAYVLPGARRPYARC
jgi:hypothetical protein